MTSPLADRLRRHATTIADPAVRATLFRSLITASSDEELLDALSSLAAAPNDAPSRVALLSLHVALSALPARQRALFEPGAAYVDTDGEGPAPPDEDDQRRVPDYGRGRPLTLGERKALARKPDRRMFDRVLRDPHPDVIALLLDNPRLTELDVVHLCSRRPGVPEVLLRVGASARWSLRPAVRRALAMNPATPPAMVSSVLPLLAADELRAIMLDERTPEVVVRRCEALLAIVARGGEG
jgi:hypothetical protein